MSNRRVNVIAAHVAGPCPQNGTPAQVSQNTCATATAPSATSKAETKKKRKPPAEIVTADQTNLSAVPPPVSAELEEGSMFPSFPQMKKDYERLNRPAMFSYTLAGGKRMTVVADRELFRVVFFPDHENLTSNQAALAHHWFGIEKDLSMDYTDKGLQLTRKALKQSKAKNMNDHVAKGILDQFEQFGLQGEADLMDFAWLTFWPVNEAMFGPNTVSRSVCPHIREELERYNSSFELVANGMPRQMFPEMEAAAQNISAHFGAMIDNGNADLDTCPVLQARVHAIDSNDTRWSSSQKGRFVMSVFWAAQANTIPGTFWALVHALADPRIKAKCIAEARAPGFRAQPGEDGKFDMKQLPYINAVVKEMLRLKVANITHRKAQRDFAVKTKSGNLLRVEKGDMLTVCSYLQHYDEQVFHDPEQFIPERWLDGAKYPTNAWFPFGGGPHTCSGKFLALQEIPTLLGLFFREFDAELLDPVPAEEWENVVAMVSPKQPFQCRVRFSRA